MTLVLGYIEEIKDTIDYGGGPEKETTRIAIHCMSDSIVSNSTSPLYSLCPKTITMNISYKEPHWDHSQHRGPDTIRHCNNICLSFAGSSLMALSSYAMFLLYTQNLYRHEQCNADGQIEYFVDHETQYEIPDIGDEPFLASPECHLSIENLASILQKIIQEISTNHIQTNNAIYEGFSAHTYSCETLISGYCGVEKDFVMFYLHPEITEPDENGNRSITINKTRIEKNQLIILGSSGAHEQVQQSFNKGISDGNAPSQTMLSILNNHINDKDIPGIGGEVLYYRAAEGFRTGNNFDKVTLSS